MKIRPWRFLTALASLCPAAWAAGLETGAAGLTLHPVKDQATHAMLRDQAGAADPVLRMEALDAFGQIRDPADGEKAMALLTDPDPRVRGSAVAAAVACGLNLDRDRFHALLKDPDAGVRAAAFAAAPSLGETVGGEELAAGLADAEPAVRAAAAQAILHRSPADASVARLLERETDLAALHLEYASFIGSAGPGRTRWLAWGLNHQVPVVRAAALQALEERGQGLEPAVLGLLRDPSAAVVDAAVSAVGRLRIADGVTPCLALLDDAESLRRILLCRALASFEDGRVVQALVRQLELDQDPFVYEAAVLALLRIRTGAAQEALLGNLGHGHARVRSWSAAALGTWADPVAGPALLSLLEDGDTAVQAAALRALAALDYPEARGQLELVRRLAVSEDEGVCAAAFRLLGKLGDVDSSALMLAVLQSIQPGDPWEPREAAFRALADLGLSDRYALAMTHLTEPVVPVVPAVMGPIFDLDEVRIAALHYLVRFKAPDIAEALLTRFSVAPPPAVRDALARHLTALTVRTYQPEPDQDFRRYSVESLGDPPFPLRPDPPGVRPST